jgi:hypothetical protein
LEHGNNRRRNDKKLIDHKDGNRRTRRRCMRLIARE